MSKRRLNFGWCVLEERQEFLSEREHGAVGLKVVSHVSELYLLEVNEQVLEDMGQKLLEDSLAQVGLVLGYHEELGLTRLEERCQQLDVLT